MTSVTITKPAKWTWVAGSIEVPGDATNLVWLEPFWAVNDFGLLDGVTHADATGKTFTWFDSNASPSFSWGTNANVGANIKRNVKFGDGDGMEGSHASFAGATRTHLFVVQRNGSDTGEWFGTQSNSVNGYGFRFDASGHVQVFDHNTGTNVATSTGVITDTEWHVVGVVVNQTTQTVKFFIDGAASGSFSSLTNVGQATIKRELWHFGFSVPGTAASAFALVAEWSIAQNDAFMTAITADPYRVLRQGGVTTKTITLGLKTKAGVGQASLTGLHWAVWRGVTSPADITNPLESGTTETTDGSGQIVIPLSNGAWVNGDIAWLMLMKSDGSILDVYKAAVVVV